MTEHAAEREAFGGRLVDLQAVRMELADLYIRTSVMRTHVDQCVVALNAGGLTPAEAAAAKYAATETQWDVADKALQMFGGYGYMDEYPISRLWRDARVQRIYGGANEVMKDLVGRALVRGDLRGGR